MTQETPRPPGTPGGGDAAARPGRGRRTVLYAAMATVIAGLVVAVLALTTAGSGDSRADLISGNYGAAHARLLEAAHSGDASAQNSIGNLYLLGLGVRRDYGAAADWYLKAALQDNAAAQVNLGHVHNQGLGVRKDLIQAFGWFRLAKKKGSEIAEKHMKHMAGGALMTPNMVQRAQLLFPDLETVRKRMERRAETKR
ncbi:MAG: tetratricopeptide repeat protein [Methyloligellaceae bacterium]